MSKMEFKIKLFNYILYIELVYGKRKFIKRNENAYCFDFHITLVK